MPNTINRRRALTTLAATSLTAIYPNPISAAPPSTCTLGYSTYGSPTLPLPQTLNLIAKTGYDSTEITIFPDRDAAPQNITTPQRKSTRNQLLTLNLKLTSLMHNLRPLVDAPTHQQNLLHLKQAAQLAHDLAPNSPPCIQTVLGGKGDWTTHKTQLRDQLGDWLETATESKTVIAIKPHRGHIMSTPTQAAWLINQLGNSPRLRITYDYSHFAFRDMPLKQTITDSLPYLAHVAVKDVIVENDKPAFKLPGETGLINYPLLLKQLYQGGYRKDICVEISSQVWRQPNYNTQTAMQTSYKHMAQAFKSANIPRP